MGKSPYRFLEAAGGMKIALIGAGNVATHMAEAFYDRGELCQVVARTRESASRLAAKINRDLDSARRSHCHCDAVNDLGGLRDDMDLYLIAVNDDSVESVVCMTPDFQGIWAHTSGSVSLDVFRGRKSNYGVFYPLQTFSRDVPVRFDDVPMLVEGSSRQVAGMLFDMASKISRRVMAADSKTREAIHVAAVFACNFANLMWSEADRLLRPQGMDIRFMLPLLQATLDKLAVKTPREAMTGPARRGDMAVIDKHLVALPPDLKTIYSLLTEKIINLYKTDEQDRI